MLPPEIADMLKLAGKKRSGSTMSFNVTSSRGQPTGKCGFDGAGIKTRFALRLRTLPLKTISTSFNL